MADRRRRVGGLLAVVVLVACQTQAFRPGNPLYIAKVKVVRPLVVPAGSARSIYQQGKAVGHVDDYQTHCELEISTVSESPQVIKPDEFVVVGGATAVLSDPDARIPAGFAFRPSACLDPVYHEVRYRLGSTRQPKVRQLRCLQAYPSCWAHPGYPRPDAIREALGDAFEIK